MPSLQHCPYDELGCKFLHSFAEECKLGHTCKRRLCPNRHGKRGDIDRDIDCTDEVRDISEKFETKETEFDAIKTSTPKKRKFQCEECKDKSQCIDCYVRQDNQMEYWT